MLIGIDASRANRSHRSGTEWYSYYIIKEIAALDRENQYILYSDQPLSGELLDLTAASQPAGGAVQEQTVHRGWQKINSPHNNFRGKHLSWPLPFFWTQLRLSWEMLIHRVDVLFIPAHALPRIHPRKSMVTIHDIGFERERMLYQEDYLGPRSNVWRRIINLLVRIFTWGKYGATMLDYHSWSARFALTSARKVISISNFSKQELIDVYGAKADKIKVIYHGYNNLIYQKINNQREIAEALAKYDISGPYIFYVGRLEKKKNIPALVEAFAVMREDHPAIRHKLVLVGDPSHGYDEVEYNIREFNLDDEVIVTGWIPEADMPYIFNGAAAFIYPSRYEGFGIPLLQAMACGTPIATSWAASIPEVVDEAALFFNPYDIRAIASAMAKIILDQKLRQDLIAKGFRRAKNFNWRKCAEATLKELTSM